MAMQMLWLKTLMTTIHHQVLLPVLLEKVQHRVRVVLQHLVLMDQMDLLWQVINQANRKMPLEVVERNMEKIRMMWAEVHLLGTHLLINRVSRILLLITFLLGRLILKLILHPARNIPARPHFLHLPTLPRVTIHLRNMIEDREMTTITVIQGAHVPRMTILNMVTLQGAHAPRMTITPRRAHAPGVRVPKTITHQHPDLEWTQVTQNHLDMAMKWSM
jgi:hypothetical protein